MAKKTASVRPLPLRVRPSTDAQRKLKAAAKAAGRTLAKELALRLEASVGESAALDTEKKRDPKTYAVMKAIGDLASQLSLDDAWHEDRFAFEVFKAGIMELLARYQPAGEPVVSNKGLGVIYQQGDDPEAVGRRLARYVTRESWDKE